MSLITCPACAKEISPRAQSCPHCGEPFRPVTTQPATSPVTIGCTAVAIILLVIWCVNLLNAPRQSSSPLPADDKHWVEPHVAVPAPRVRFLGHGFSYHGPTVAYGISMVSGYVTNETDQTFSASIHYSLFSDFNEQGSVVGTASDYISALPGHTA